MRALVIRQIQAQQLLLAVDVQTEDGVDRLADIATVFLDLVVDGVEPDDRLNGLQITFAPRLKLAQQASLSVTVLMAPAERQMPYRSSM
jgi:hypothetical protein